MNLEDYKVIYVILEDGKELVLSWLKDPTSVFAYHSFTFAELWLKIVLRKKIKNNLYLWKEIKKYEAKARGNISRGNFKLFFLLFRTFTF